MRLKGLCLQGMRQQFTKPGQKICVSPDPDSRSGQFRGNIQQRLVERKVHNDCGPLRSPGGDQSLYYEQAVLAWSAAPTGKPNKCQRPSKQRRLHFKQVADKMIKEIRKDPHSFNMEDVEGNLPAGVANNLKAKDKFMNRIQTAYAKAMLAQHKKDCKQNEILLGRIISL